MPTLAEQIDDALARVRNPRTGDTVLAAEMVRDVATTTDGKVRLTVLLDAEDDATIVREVRRSVEAIPGVSDVQVDVKPRSEKAGERESEKRPRGGRVLPTIDNRPQAARPAAPTPVPFPNLGQIIAVSSGKGGVGKSTVAVNLAIALARMGKRVGLMDADIYGPNLPRMLGMTEPPQVNEKQKIEPHLAYGLKMISLGLLIERDQPAIWRGPIVMKIITQFLQDVDWGQLDYLFVDMPPGTGDAQLSLVQATQVAGAVIVTTPQEVSVGDALRGAKMFQRVGVPVLGIVENMSYLECQHCGKPMALFGSGGGARLAKELELPLLGEIPLFPQVMTGGDTGRPIVVAEPDSKAAKEIVRVAEQVLAATTAGAGVRK